MLILLNQSLIFRYVKAAIMQTQLIHASFLRSDKDAFLTYQKDTI